MINTIKGLTSKFLATLYFARLEVSVDNNPNSAETARLMVQYGKHKDVVDNNIKAYDMQCHNASVRRAARIERVLDTVCAPVLCAYDIPVICTYTRMVQALASHSVGVFVAAWYATPIGALAVLTTIVSV